MPSAPRLILASASPRRRAFLRGLGLRFSTVSPDISEEPRPGETAHHYARRVAQDKALAVLRHCAAVVRSARTLIIAADTIVACGREFLPKPRNASDARRMLRRLAGRSHQVVTGVCVLEAQNGRITRRRCFVVTTRVWFKPLTDDEIRGYVATGEPMDKAGAYAIQGIGSFLVRRIAGSYTNVVGLPVAELLDCLEKDFGLKIFR